jgi:L-lactate dehydrogenase complex protein LldE
LLPKVYEFSEFLTRGLGVEDVGAYYPHRVTYHASCHGLRNLHLGDGPLKLLRAVRGIDLVELAGVEQCCGFGGTFAVKNAEVSSAMLGEKVQAILNTKAEACTACDNSCLMHIEGALHRQRTGVRTLHLAEILASEEGDRA